MSEQNARLIEEDIFTLAPDQAGDSRVINLFGESGNADRLICQAVYFPSGSGLNDGDARDFYAPTQATVDIQDVHYIANAGGSAGNDISIECIDNGVPAQELTVNVTPPAISVLLGLDAGADANLTLQNVYFEAINPGVDGNDITVVFINPGFDGDLIYTEDGTNIIIYLATDSEGNSTTTTGQVYTIVNSESTLVFANVVIEDYIVQDEGPASLSGGGPPLVQTDTMSLADAITTFSGGLVTATTDFFETVIPVGPTFLSGGTDGDINLDDSSITIIGHGYETGLEVQLSTTGALPSPLLTDTNYFIIAVDDDHIRFAATLEDALDNIAITLGDTGTPGSVDTVTPEGAASGSVKFQKSNDGINWVDIETQVITTAGSHFLRQPNVAYRYFKAVKTIDSGDVNLESLVLVIGDPMK